MRRIWGFSNWSLVELVEAGARSGKTEAAADALERLAQIAACCTDWALGTEARSRALVSEGEAAENLYQEAIRRLDRARVRVELARAHLLYGEWLRRERRRLDARKQLRHAHELFSQFGIEAFAERARGELEATGEHARKTHSTDARRPDPPGKHRSPASRPRVSPTKTSVAAQLFSSPSTVDYHLRKAFRKLGVKSRYELKQHVLQPGAHADTAARGH